MATIAEKKSDQVKWTPIWVWDVILKDTTPRYWSTQVVTWDGNPYEALVLDHSGCKVEGPGIYGVDSVGEISLVLNNADANLNTILTPSNLQGGTVQPRLILVDPDTGATTSDAITFGKFLFDLPSETWPRCVLTAHNKMNLARKDLPVSRITKKDRYPFPSTAAERTTAGSNPTSPFYAIGYNPDTAKGNYAIGFTASTAGTDATHIVVATGNYNTKPDGMEAVFTSGAAAGQYRRVITHTATTLTLESALSPAPSPGDVFVAYYTADSYNNTRDVDDIGVSVGLESIGLSARFGGFGKTPETITYTPKKGEHAEFKGSANETKIGQPVPLMFGVCRIRPPILDTGGPSAWNGARLGHYLLSDGVNFAPVAADYGIEKRYATQQYPVTRVLLKTPTGKQYDVPYTSNQTSVTGSWTVYEGHLGSQVPALDAYRNIIPATDLPGDDFQDRDLYSGLAFLALGLPKELAAQDSDLGPEVEVVTDGLRIETWNNAVPPVSTWQWSDNPVWIFVHLLKLLRWSTTDMDKASIYSAAAYCDEPLYAFGPKRFRCNLALVATMKATDVLRGIRNNCRLYTAYGTDGQLQLKIEKIYAEETGTPFALGSTNIARDDAGALYIKKFYKSIYETANTYSVNFQDERNQYISDSLTLYDLDNIEQIDEAVSGDSITAILGIPNYAQAERQLWWLKSKGISLNEYYQVRTTLYSLGLQVGQVGTITEPRLGLNAQQCRIVSITAGPSGTVDLTLQKHADIAYSDTSKPSPLIRARSDTTYSPRSAGGVSGPTGNPTLTELFIQDDLNREAYNRKVKADFSVPSQTYSDGFSSRIAVSDLQVQTTGGSLAGTQILFVEVCPDISGLEGLASDTLLANIPTGTATNKFTFTCELPAEATHYVVRVGQYPGRLFKYSRTASPGTAPFTITVTSIAALDSSSLSPDPLFDHVRIFYQFDGSTEIRDAGRTESPTETSFVFEPQSLFQGDTTITVWIVSANAAETDFYPFGASPNSSLALTKDTGNPSGASGLVIVGHSDLDTIPLISMAFAFARDTVNFRGIYAVMVNLSSSLPAQGPYAVERAAYPTSVIEPAGGTPANCTVVAGATRVTMTRAADAAVVGRVLLIFTNDGTPDSDLDGNIIVGQGTNYIDIHPTRPFYKGGAYQYLVVKRWWDYTVPGETANLWSHTYLLGELQNELYDAQWLTNSCEMYEGDVYATAYSRNAFGVGTRMVSALKTLAYAWTVGNFLGFQIVSGTIVGNGVNSVSWTSVVVAYKGTQYNITNGSTTLEWIYWQLASPTVFQASASIPTPGEDGVYIGLNESGTFLSQWKAGAVIFAQRIVAASLSVISATLGTVTAGSLSSVTITASYIYAPAATGNRIELGVGGYAKLQAITTGGTAVLTISAVDVGNVLAIVGDFGVSGALVAGSLQAASLSITGTSMSLGGATVLRSQQTGWTAASGTATKGGYATYTAPDISATYVEAEVQAIADGLQAVSRSLKATIDALLYHGAIGA